MEKAAAQPDALTCVLCNRKTGDELDRCGEYNEGPMGAVIECPYCESNACPDCLGEGDCCFTIPEFVNGEMYAPPGWRKLNDNDYGRIMLGETLFSPDRRYRYSLLRKWDYLWADPDDGIASMLFVMLNPSKADETDNDPTIRRCINYAKREHCQSLLVLNLFAMRSTDPRELYKSEDPIGPSNDTYIRKFARMAAMCGAPVVFAWGKHGVHRSRCDQVIDIFRSEHCKTFALKVLDGGIPGHPLYLKNTAPLIPFPPAAIDVLETGRG